VSDDPRGFRNGLWLRRLFALLDAFAVSPALLLAFCFGRRRRPVTLLRLPSRPLPRRLPTFCAAIALARRHRTKTPLTAFQQTGARPRPAARAFAAAVLLHWGEMSRILNRAHGSLVPGKLMPRRGRLSSPGRSSSGSLRTQDFIAPTRVVALGFPLRPLIRALEQGWEFCQGRAQRARRAALTELPTLPYLTVRRAKRIPVPGCGAVYRLNYLRLMRASAAIHYSRPAADRRAEMVP